MMLSQPEPDVKATSSSAWSLCAVILCFAGLKLIGTREERLLCAERPACQTLLGLKERGQSSSAGNRVGPLTSP